MYQFMQNRHENLWKVKFYRYVAHPRLHRMNFSHQPWGLPLLGPWKFPGCIQIGWFGFWVRGIIWKIQQSIQPEYSRFGRFWLLHVIANTRFSPNIQYINCISLVPERAEATKYVGESRNFDPLDLLQMSKRFAEYYRFYSTELTTICCGRSDMAETWTS